MILNDIYDNHGTKVQSIKQSDSFKKETNDLYMKLCQRFGGSWNSDAANAFQHAYISARFTYQYDENISKLIGNYTELTTWSEDINDTKKDLYNNNVGIEMAKNGIANNLTLDQIAESIFKKKYKPVLMNL